MLHISDNIKLIRALLDQTQPQFIKNFTGITVPMQKSYESAKADPGILYIEELSELSGVSEKDLKNKKLAKSDLKNLAKKEEKAKKEGDRNSGEEGFFIEKDQKIIGNIYERLIRLEANIRALNSAFIELRHSISGESTTMISLELEKTSAEVADMLFDELKKKSLF